MKAGTASFYRYFPVSGRDKKWGLYATTAGESRIAPQAVYPPIGHPKGYAFDWKHGRVLDEFVLVYISSGRGKFESKPNFTTDFSARIEPGHAFLLFPGIWHRYAPDPKTGWHEHWIGFDGKTARSWLQNRFVSAKNPILKINAEDTVLATFSRALQAVKTSRPALQQILAGAAGALFSLFYSAQQTQSAVEIQNPNAVELAIAHIQDEFARALDMKCLAQELGVSYSRFRAAFAAHTGLSPHQYLLELRIVHARNLLAETKFSVKEIARQTGFADEHYFSRLFRRKLGHAPSEWRNRCRAKSPRK